MIENNRTGNCIRFLPIAAEDTVLFCRDMPEGVCFFTDEQGLYHAQDAIRSVTQPGQKRFSYVIYRMDPYVEGTPEVLEDKISRVFLVLEHVW